MVAQRQLCAGQGKATVLVVPGKTGGRTQRRLAPVVKHLTSSKAWTSLRCCAKAKLKPSTAAARPGQEWREGDSSSHFNPSRGWGESMFVCFSFRAPLPPPLGKESIEALSYQACWPLDLGWVLLRRWAGTRDREEGMQNPRHGARKQPPCTLGQHWRCPLLQGLRSPIAHTGTTSQERGWLFC